MMFGKRKKRKISKEELLDTIILAFKYHNTTKGDEFDSSSTIYHFNTIEKSKISFTLSGKYMYAKNTLDSGGINFIKVTNALDSEGKNIMIYHMNITEFLKYCDTFNAAVVPSDRNDGKNVIKYTFHITYNTIGMTLTTYETELYSSVQKHLINTALNAIYSKSL